MKIRKKSGNRINFPKRKSSYHMWERNNLFFEIIWRFDENPEKFGKIRKPDKFSEEKIIISYVYKQLILKRNLKTWWKSGKIRKPDKFSKRKSSYHMCINNLFFKEIWRFDENPEKNPEKSGNRKKSWKIFHHIIFDK